MKVDIIYRGVGQQTSVLINGVDIANYLIDVKVVIGINQLPVVELKFSPDEWTVNLDTCTVDEATKLAITKALLRK